MRPKISFVSFSCLIAVVTTVFCLFVCLFVCSVFSCFVIQNIYFFNDRILGYSSTNVRCYIHKIAPTNFSKQGWNCSSSFSMMYMTVKDWQVCFRFVFYCSVSCASLLHFNWLNGKFWLKPATHLAILYADRGDRRIKSPISGMSGMSDFRWRSNSPRSANKIAWCVAGLNGKCSVVWCGQVTRH